MITSTIKTIACCIMLLLLTGASVSAQQGTIDTASLITPSSRPAIVLLAKSYGDSVVLRWAPTTPGAWSVGNRFGYIVERVPAIEGEITPDMMKRLTPQSLKPWPLEEWKSRAARDNKWAAVSAQTLYGKKTSFAEGEDEITSLYHAGIEFSNRHGFALFAADNDATAPDGLALRFVDRGVKAGEHYAYRVYTLRDTAADFTIDTGYAFVTVTKHQQPDAPVHVEAIGLDGAIKVAWDDFSFAGFTGYHLYRSEDGGRTYSQLTKSPMTFASQSDTLDQRPMIYVDSAVTNYHTYHYQLRGITPFAELSAPATDSTYPRDLTPASQPQIDGSKQVGPHQVLISWTVADTAGDLAGFQIERGAKVEGPYRIITPQPLPRDIRSYLVEDADEKEAYFVISSVDTAGNLNRSLPMLGEAIDTLPPSLPRGLAGTIDTAGIVRLHWDLGPEEDIVGYRVLFANDSTDEFTQLTGEPWADTTFTDTVELKTLTRHVYYRIAAVDIRQNHSAMSRILQLERPDKVAPERSVFNDVVVSDSSVLLRWAPSTSSDLARQLLMRRAAGETSWREIARLEPNVASYVDRDVKKKVTYEYTLIAEDRSGLRSDASPAVQGRPYDNGARAGVNGLQATFDPKTRRIILNWRYTPPSGENFWFVIYRGGLEGELSQFQAIEGKERSFIDSDTGTRPVYRYAVRVMTDAGESPFSDVAVVALNR
jgi:fibronectin type 3 domain-containing protein